MPRMWLCFYTPSRAPSALNPPQKISVFPGRSPGTSCSWRRLQRRCAARARPGSGAPATQTVVTPAADPSLSAASTSAQATPSHSEPSLDSSSAAPAAAAAPLDATASAWGAKLMLLGTAALWGTYAPSLRLVYTMPLPPDPVVVMAVRGTLQTGALLLAAALAAPDGEGSSSGGAGSSSQQPGTSGSGARSSAAGSGEAVPAEEAMRLLKRWLRQQSPPLWVAALELGLWNYGATALQVGPPLLPSAFLTSYFFVCRKLLNKPIKPAYKDGYRTIAPSWRPLPPPCPADVWAHAHQRHPGVVSRPGHRAAHPAAGRAGWPPPQRPRVGGLHAGAGRHAADCTRQGGGSRQRR